MQGAVYVVSDSCPSSACTGLIRCVSWLRLDRKRLPARIHVFFMENPVSERVLYAIWSTPFRALQTYSTLTRHAFAINQSNALHFLSSSVALVNLLRTRALRCIFTIIRYLPRPFAGNHGHIVGFVSDGVQHLFHL